MKKHFLPFSLIIVSAFSLTAQVQVDQPIEFTGSEGSRKITNLELPIDGTDAVNKNYVDNAVAASGGGGLPTMLSAESASQMHLGDAIRYCRNLVEDGYTDWRLPNYDDLIAAASTDDTVSNESSANYIHIATYDGSFYSQSVTSAGSGYRSLATRLSDGARNVVDYSSFPWYNTRCVR